LRSLGTPQRQSITGNKQSGRMRTSPQLYIVLARTLRALSSPEAQQHQNRFDELQTASAVE